MKKRRFQYKCKKNSPITSYLNSQSFREIDQTQKDTCVYIIGQSGDRSTCEKKKEKGQGSQYKYIKERKY